MEISIPIAFIIGLFSAAHCFGMCGSITGALTLGLPMEIRNQPGRLARFVLVYNLGRILSYTLAGALLGMIGSGFAESNWLQGGHEIARIFSSLAIILAGFYITGWIPQLQWLERIGEPIWRYLEPIGRRLLPVKTMIRALMFGIIWGWIPCGLVYYVLLLTLSTGDPITGALCMLSFGLGTLPAMMGIALVAGLFTKVTRNTTARTVVGLLLVAAGIAWLLFGKLPEQQTEQGIAQAPIVNHHLAFSKA